VLRVPEHSVAWRLPNQSTLAVKRQNATDISDSAILIEMRAAAVCGTDLAILSGARPGGAAVLGHEGVGSVLHAPTGCGISKGSRVIINPVYRNHPQLVVGHSHDGIFRKYFWLDAAEAVQENLLLPCPAECAIADTELVLTEPVGSVLYSLELLREKCGDSPLLVRGSGTVAILAVKLWSRLTGAPAILASGSAEHADWLRQSVSWPENVRICSNSQLRGVIAQSDHQCRAGILCCSRENAPEGLHCLLDFVADGAMIDLMAGFPEQYQEARLGGIPLDAVRWNNICGMSSAPPTSAIDGSSGRTVSLIGHRGTGESHLLQAVDLLSRKVVSLADVPHRVVELQQLPDVVQTMLSIQQRHRNHWVKAIVACA